MNGKIAYSSLALSFFIGLVIDYHISRARPARQSLLGTYLISILLVGLAILGLVYVIVNKRKIGTKKRAEKDPRRE